MTAKTSARLLQPHTTTATAATEHITGTAISHVQPGKASQLASTPMSSPNSIVFDALLVAVSVLSTLLVVAVVFLVVAIRLLRRVTAAHMSYERDYFDTNEEVEDGETTQENTWSTTAESRTTSNAVDEQRPLLQRTAPSREQQRQQRHQRRRRGVPAASLMNALRIVLGFSVDESDHDGDSDTYDASSRSDGQWQRTTARSLNHARRHDEAAHEQQRQPKVTAVHDEGAHSPLSRSPARSSADQREARVEPSSSVGAGVAGRQQSSVSGVASPTLPPSVHDRAAERQAGLGAGAAAVVAGTATNDDKKEEEEKEAEAIPFHAATHKDLVVFNTTQDSRYRLLQRIGMGAFSSVYLVQHKTTGQTYALKYILCQDDRERLAALRECEVIHSLQGHPQVIRIADMFMHYQFQPGKKARMPTTTSVNSTQLRNASPQSPSLWARPAPTAVAPASPPSLLNVPQSSQPQPQLPSSPPTHAGPQFRLPAASVSSNACGPSSVPSSNAVLAARTRSTAGVVSASPTSATAAATQWVGVQLQGLHDQVMDKLSSAMRPEDNDVLAALRARMRTADLRGGSGDVNDTSRKVGTGRGRDVVGDAAHDVDDEDSRGGRSRFKSDRRPNSSASREEEEEGTTDGGGEGSEDRTPTESKSAPLILSAADAERLLADARLLQQQGRRQRRHRQRVHETQKQHHMGHDDNHTQATTATTTTRGPAGPAAVSDGPRFHAARPSTPISPLPQCLQNDAKSASQQQQQQQGYCYQHSGMEDGRVVYAQLIPKDEMGNSCSVTDGITATMATATGPRSSTALLTNVTTHNSTSRRSSSFSAEHTRGDNEDVDATTESEGAAPSRTPASLPLDKEELRGQLLALEQQQQQQLEDRNGQCGCSRNSNSSSSSSSSSTDSSSGAKEEPIQPIRRVWVPPPSYMQPLPSLLLTEGEANSREKLGRSSIAPPVEEEQWGKQQQQQQQQQPSAPTSYVSRNRYANFALNADRLFEKEDGKEKKEAAVATLFTTVPRKTTPLLPPPPRTPQSIARNDAAAEADVDAPSPAAATAAAMAHSSYASRVQQQQAATVPSSYAPALSPSSLSWSSSVTPFSTRPANSYAPMRTTAQVTSLAEAAAAAAAAREDSKADTGLDWKASTLFTMESVNQSGTALTPAPHAASATCGPTRDGRVGHYVNPYLERARGGEVVPPPRTSYAPGGGVRYSSLVTPLADTASTPPQQQQQQQQQSSSSSPSLVMRSSYAPLRYRNLVQFIASTAPAPTSDTTAAAAAPVSGVASTSGRLSVSAAIRSARAGQQGERMHLNDGKPHVHVPMPQLWGGLVPPRPFTNPNELNRTHVVYGHRRGDSAEEDGGVGQAVEPPKTAHGNESHTHNSNGVHTCQELFLTGNGETAAYSDAPSPQQPLYTNLGVTLTDAEPTLARVVAKGTETTTALLSPFNTATRAVASYGATGQTSNAVLNANNANTNTTYSCAPRARTYAPAVRYANAGNPTLWSTYGQPGGAVIGPASVAAARATAEGLKEARNNSDGSSGNEVNNADGGDAALESNPHGKGHGSSSSAAGTASATTHSHSSSLTQDVRDTGYLCLVMEYHPMGDLCHYYLRAKQQLALQEHQQQQLFMRNSVSHATFDARSTVSLNTPMSSDRSSVLCAGADAGARSNVGLAPAASSLTGGFSNLDPRSPSVMTGGSAATTTTTATAVTTSVTGAAAAAASWITAAAAATWRMKPAVSRHSVNIAMPTTSTITTTTTTADPNKREPLRRDEEERTDPTSRNPLTEPQLLSIGYQLASVLDHMHHQSPPIIHRDLKPENILIKGALSEFLDDVPAEFVTGGVGGGATSTEPVSPVTPANAASPHRHEKGKAGNPSHGNTNHVGAAATLAFPPPIRITRAIVPIVVTDFGLAMLQETYGGHRAGRGGGTRPYIAPECWEGGTCTASDVWSLGCVLYALATGRLTARTVRLMSEEARRDGFASRMLNDILSQKYSLAFASFVVSLLVVDPAKRPTAAQAAQCFLVTEHEVRFDSSSPFFSNVLDL